MASTRPYWFFSDRLHSLAKPLLLFLVLFISGNAFSQGDSVDVQRFQGFKNNKIPLKQNVIKTNIIPVLVGQMIICGELRFTYERMLSHNHSLSLGASYNFPNLLLFVVPAVFNPNQNTLKAVSMRGGRLMLGYRFYPFKKTTAPRGFFFGPYFSYNFVKIKERKGNGSYQILNYANASMVAGYQFHLSKGVFLEFFGGLGYRNNFSVYYDAYHKTYTRETFSTFAEEGPIRRHIKVILQINLGFGF